MPQEGPGKRFPATATKACTHNDPVVELNHPGVAAKSSQVAAMAPSVANALLATQIAIGEEFVIMLDGVHTIDSSHLPGGAAVGNRLFILATDNTLHLAADALTGGVLNANYSKFGVIDEIDTQQGRAAINLNLKDSF